MEGCVPPHEARNAVFGRMTGIFRGGAGGRAQRREALQSGKCGEMATNNPRTVGKILAKKIIQDFSEMVLGGLENPVGMPSTGDGNSCNSVNVPGTVNGNPLERRSRCFALRECRRRIRRKAR
jgi:hypothetical protein